SCLQEEGMERGAGGLLDNQARGAARRDLGNVTRLREETRTLWTWMLIEQLAQDLRYAVRTMGRNPTFTAMAALSLALGIGANTAIYSFMDAILLRPLPVPDPQSLVVMKWHAQGYTLASSGFSQSTGGTSFDSTTGTLSSSFPYPALKLFQDSTGVLTSAFCYFVASHLRV